MANLKGRIIKLSKKIEEGDRDQRLKYLIERRGQLERFTDALPIHERNRYFNAPITAYESGTAVDLKDLHLHYRELSNIYDEIKQLDPHYFDRILAEFTDEQIHQLMSPAKARAQKEKQARV